MASPTDLGASAIKDIAGALNALLADTFALYLKTKNFHWHMNGPHFRDYHLLLDDHGDELFAMTDVLAERVRKIGGTTIRSIGHIARQQRIADNDAAFVTPLDMLAELRDDNQRFMASMREAHDLCDEHNDVATTSLLENYIDDAEKRSWFLFELNSGPERIGSVKLRLSFTDGNPLCGRLVVHSPCCEIGHISSSSARALADLKWPRR